MRAARCDREAPVPPFLSSCFASLLPRLWVKGARTPRNRRIEKMKLEQAKQIASSAIEQLRQALEAGHSERLTEYLGAIARFHRYSWHNIMLIASQKSTATHVAGFHTWHKLGRFVKKGEKGILILAPIIRGKAENTSETEADESSTAVGFRAAYVFDISQTDGQELPEIGNVNGDPREYRERLGKFVTEQGILLEYSQDITPLAAPPQVARSHCCPDKLLPRTSQHWRMKSHTN